MGLTQRINYNSYTGYQILDNRLTVATGFKHKTKGIEYKFDGVDLKIYMYILQRQSYKKHKGQRYYESLDRICVASTGTNYRTNGTNRKRIKKLCDIGLITVETVKIKEKEVFKDGGFKQANNLDDALLYWHLINPFLCDFDNDDKKLERIKEKSKRLKSQEEKKQGEVLGRNAHRLKTLYSILESSPDCDNTLREIRLIEDANREKIYYKEHSDYRTLFKCIVTETPASGVINNTINELPF